MSSTCSSASRSSAQSSLPPPKDLSHHISHSTKSRGASDIKKLYKYLTDPRIGQIAGGLPNAGYFPYDDLEAKVSLPDRWEPTSNKPVDPSKKNAAKEAPPSSRLIIPKASATPNVLRKIDLESALQYGLAQGYPPLYDFLRHFTRENLHPNIPYAGGPEVILTVGSTDGFAKALQCFNNEWTEGKDPIEEKEGLLVEEYAYMNAIQTAEPRGMNIVPVTIDEQGMAVAGKGGLKDVLENWDTSKGKRPHLMYTVPVGQNPTSGTVSIQRRKEIYALCEEFDILILEDDPYWYLQYPSATSEVEPPQKSSGFAFLDSLVPSYLSIDVSGRVVRIDTFSKTIAPGCRLGWITAQPAFIERILRITETSTQQPSGFVQAMVAELIMGPSSSDPSADAAGWKVDGWVRWLEGLRGEYERRMNIMCDTLDTGKELVKQGRRNSLAQLTAELSLEDSAEDADEWAVVEKTTIYSFARPMGGMFLWLRFDFSSHPLASQVPQDKLSRALWVTWLTKPYFVAVSPGTVFGSTPEIRVRDAWKCFRLCFAAVNTEDLEGICKRLVKGAHTFWRIKDAKKIDDLLEDFDINAEVEENPASLGGFC